MEVRPGVPVGWKVDAEREVAPWAVHVLAKAVLEATGAVTEAVELAEEDTGP